MTQEQNAVARLAGKYFKSAQETLKWEQLTAEANQFASSNGFSGDVLKSNAFKHAYAAAMGTIYVT